MSKKFIITGASRGIGKAITEQLLKEGHQIIGIARHFEDPLFQHPHFTQILADLTHLDRLPDIFQNLAKKYPDIDGIICNAGKWFYGHLEQMSFKQMQDVFHVNVLSHMFLVRAFLPLFKQRKSGCLLFIGSESALHGRANQALYSASKSALRGFVQAIRSECATKNIVISMIHPGLVMTDFHKDAPFDLSEDPQHHLTSQDIAQSVSFILNARPGCVVEEMLLSPQKHHIKPRQNLSASQDPLLASRN